MLGVVARDGDGAKLLRAAILEAGHGVVLDEISVFAKNPWSRVALLRMNVGAGGPMFTYSLS